MVQNSDSGAVVTKLHVSSGQIDACCFSPDDKFLVGGVGKAIHIWDIINSDPHLVKTLEHSYSTNSLVFSSSLISSHHGAIKFWKFGASSMDTVGADSESTPLPPPIESVHLHADSGIAVSSDSAGVVRTWDILTGLHKASFHTPTPIHIEREVQLIDGQLIAVWLGDKQIHIWDVEKGEDLQVVDAPIQQ